MSSLQRVVKKLALGTLLAIIMASSAYSISSSSSGSSGDESGCRETSLCILIPRFNGPDELGLSVATILNLQILQTLHRARDGVWFDSEARILWSETPLERPRYSSALERKTDCERPSNPARNPAHFAQEGCDIIFWGSVYPLGDEAITLAYLSLIEHNMPSWTVPLGNSELRASLPAMNYSFEPFALSADTVVNFSSPDALTLTDGRPLGESFKVEQWTYQNEARVHLVNSDGERVGRPGTVRIPDVETPSDAINFTAGVIRSYRKDWKGVIEKMDLVIENPGAEAQLRADAHWYRAWAMSETENADLASRELRASAAKDRSESLLAALILSELVVLSEQPQASSLVNLQRALAMYCQVPGANENWAAEIAKLISASKPGQESLRTCQSRSSGE